MAWFPIIGQMECTRTGVILAAGLGSRLAEAGENSSTKPLVYVHGEPLLNRTLRGLEIAGCSRVVIVLGHAAGIIRPEIEKSYLGPTELKFVTNEKYELQNGISVLCARPYVEDQFILTMADHVFDDEIMQLAGEHQPIIHGATLCVDFKVESVFDMDDATKVLAKDGVMQAIGKKLENFNCVDTGLFICTTALMDALEEFYGKNNDASLSNGVQTLASRGKMRVLDIKDAFWQDVDTPEMLAHAEKVLAARATDK
ncbi:MAG: NTP transferase domain-containing protein [Pseudomonadota bacterium]